MGITVLPMKTITFKVNDEEALLIRSLAKRERTSLSEYLRRRATGLPDSQAVPQRELCQYTGAMIFAPASGRPPLTTESVREMLSEFP